MAAQIVFPKSFRLLQWHKKMGNTNSANPRKSVIMKMVGSCAVAKNLLAEGQQLVFFENIERSHHFIVFIVIVVGLSVGLGKQL